jgi:hypothetical protein
MINKETNVEFRLVNDLEMPPIVITMNENDEPKVVLNNAHKIWLSLHRKVIGGCAEALFDKINDLLTGHLLDMRAYEQEEIE